MDFGCEKCSCLNGSLTCVPLACPDLGSCPTENKIQPSGACCHLCSGKCMFLTLFNLKRFTWSC